MTPALGPATIHWPAEREATLARIAAIEQVLGGHGSTIANLIARMLAVEELAAATVTQAGTAQATADAAKAEIDRLWLSFASLTERVAALEAAGDGTGTTYGAAVWSYSGADGVRPSWPEMVGALGVADLAARRTYYQPTQGIPSHYSSGGLAVDVAAGRGSQVSFKPPPGSVAAGDWDAQILSLFASKPAGLAWRVALGNEDEAPDKGIDPAARVADMLHLLDIRDDTAPDVKVTWTCMGFSHDAGRDLEPWMPPSLRARIDSVSVNHYQTMTSEWKSWHKIMEKAVAKVRDDWGLPLVMWEWGYPEDDANPTRKPDIVAEHAAWCEEYGVEVSMHYNTAKGVISKDPRYLQTSSPATTVAFQNLFAT